MRSQHTVAALSATLFLVASGCSGSDDFNDSDVSFAQDMIPHHEQAVEMAELADGRAGGDEVLDLATAISQAQGPEIDTMTTWLEEWDQEVPESMDGMDMSMPGMMSDEDMTALEDAERAEFDQLWLTLMIEHHTGAIEMAQVEQEDGKSEDAIALAEEIEQAQAAEIEQMEQLLD